MANDAEQLEQSFEFGRFTFDLLGLNLQLDGERIKLSRKAAAILAYLITNRHRWVSRQELMSEFWSDVSVEPGSVDKQISMLRTALGPDGPSYIETRYKSGWQFVAEGNFRPLAPPPFTPPPAKTEVLADPEPLLATPHPIRTAVLALAFLGACVVFAIRMLPAHEPRVVSSTQLTRDGRRKFGPLLTNGGRIFFEETFGKVIRPVSIPNTGGEAIPLAIPFPNLNASLWGISSDGKDQFLVAFDRVYKLWKYSTPSRQLRLLRTGINFFALSPDGRKYATSDVSRLSVYTLDGVVECTKDLPAAVTDLLWSPDGQAVRFAMRSFTGANSGSEWELRPRDGRLKRLSLISDGQDYVGASAWSHRGSFFFYEAGTYPELNLWVAPQTKWMAALPAPKPKRLTSGEPGWWRMPAASPEDESTVFALNYYVRCELVRLEKNSSWSTMWGSVPATELSYSKDGQWVAYVKYSENTIWKAHADGSGRLQLTVTGLDAHQPRWSPDGSRIAFVAKNGKGQWHAFQVPARGGVSQDLTNGDDQGSPSWSPDGQSLIFGERFTKKPRSEMSIHVLDLKSRRVSDMEGTRGLWSPVWSPDGRYIAAPTSDQKALRILAVPGTNWKELVRMRGMENITWSPDSRYLYFDGRQEDGHWWLYRAAIPSGKLEQVTDLEDFDHAPEAWFGIDPDGKPLGFRGLRVEEVFKLKCDLP